MSSSQFISFVRGSGFTVKRFCATRPAVERSSHIAIATSSITRNRLAFPPPCCSLRARRSLSTSKKTPRRNKEGRRESAREKHQKKADRNAKLAETPKLAEAEQISNSYGRIWMVFSAFLPVCIGAAAVAFVPGYKEMLFEARESVGLEMETRPLTLPGQKTKPAADKGCEDTARDRASGNDNETEASSA